MTKALILALALLGPVAAMAEPSLTTQAAIAAFYVGNDIAQRAFDSDVCATHDASQGDALTGEAARQYRHMSDALHAAFDASEGTDSAVERVEFDFCAAAAER